MLHKLVAQVSSTSRELTSYMSNGLLVPDELVVEIMSGHIRQLDNKKGFLLDNR